MMNQSEIDKKRAKIREGMSYKIIKLINVLDESPDEKTSRVIWDNFFLDSFTYLASEGVVIQGMSLGTSHPHLANYYTVVPLIEKEE